MSINDSSNPRATHRARREAERAARAQRKADFARERAMEAARAGGLFEGMEAMPRTGAGESARAEAAPTDASDTSSSNGEGAGRARTGQAFITPPPTGERIDPSLRRVLTPVLAAASVILVVVAVLATILYTEARKDTAAEQLIADAPHSATDAAREIATQMFTYDHRTVDADLAAVRDRLTEPALTEFVEQSLPAVASAAKQQEASVYATVAAAAPQEIVDADNVKVLVMLNRMVSTKEAPEASSSASRLELNMVQVDGTWKLGNLEAL